MKNLKEIKATLNEIEKIVKYQQVRISNKDNLNQRLVLGQAILFIESYVKKIEVLL